MVSPGSGFKNETLLNETPRGVLVARRGGFKSCTEEGFWETLT